MLLVGPPGTGKTLTARSSAAELGLNYITIVGPAVIGKYYGEAEGWLAELTLLSNQAALEAGREYRVQQQTDPSQIRIRDHHFQAAYEVIL